MKLSSPKVNNIYQQMRHYRKLAMLKEFNKRFERKKANLLAKILNQRQYMEQLDLSEDSHFYEQEPVIGQTTVEREITLADYFNALSKEDQATFIRDNPQLPVFCLMTEEEKQEYFEKLAEKYLNELKTQPQRKCKTKKILKFREEFNVRGYNEAEEVISIVQAQEFQENYHQTIHFS